MSGRMSRDCHGQLAALDAMVFFALAMLISSSTWAYVDDALVGSGADGVEGVHDPGQLLSVFLRASIGVEVVLDTDPRVTIPSREEVETCLCAELDATTSGLDGDVFGPLNEVLVSILARLAGIGYSASLSAFRTTEDGLCPMLVLETSECISENRYSGSCELPGSSGSVYLVVLTLGPALLPELGEV